MNNVYHWIGLIIFWAAAVGAAFIVVLLLIYASGWLFHKVWKRTYIFQFYEFKGLKKFCEKECITDQGIHRMLNAMKRGRFKTHIFLPQIYELILAAYADYLIKENQ